jgi:adenylate cyclase
MLDSGLVSDLESPVAKRIARARETAHGLGLDDLTTAELIQAYARGVGRIVTAEMHAAARTVESEPPESYERRLRAWTKVAAGLAVEVFQSLHDEQLGAALAHAPGPVGVIERQAVAFVDLCGSTRFMLQCSAHELRLLADELFFAAQRVADAHGASVVKYLGDGVFMLAPLPEAALEAAQQLVRELRGRTALRAAGGVAHGRVLAHAGDFLGPAVNLASRLAEAARPDEVLVDTEAWPAPLSLGVPREVSPRGLRAGWRVRAISVS